MFYDLPKELITHIYSFDPTYHKVYNDVKIELLMVFFYKQRISRIRRKIIYFYSSIDLHPDYKTLQILRLNRKITAIEIEIKLESKQCSILDNYYKLYTLFSKWVIELDRLIYN